MRPKRKVATSKEAFERNTTWSHVLTKHCHVFLERLPDTSLPSNENTRARRKRGNHLPSASNRQRTEPPSTQTDSNLEIPSEHYKKAHNKIVVSRETRHSKLESERGKSFETSSQTPEAEHNAENDTELEISKQKAENQQRHHVRASRRKRTKPPSNQTTSSLEVPSEQDITATNQADIKILVSREAGYSKKESEREKDLTAPKPAHSVKNDETIKMCRQKDSQCDRSTKQEIEKKTLISQFKRDVPSHVATGPPRKRIRFGFDFYFEEFKKYLCALQNDSEKKDIEFELFFRGLKEELIEVNEKFEEKSVNKELVEWLITSALKIGPISLDDQWGTITNAARAADEQFLSQKKRERYSRKVYSPKGGSFPCNQPQNLNFPIATSEDTKPINDSATTSSQEPYNKRKYLPIGSKTHTQTPTKLEGKNNSEKEDFTKEEKINTSNNLQTSISMHQKRARYFQTTSAAVSITRLDADETPKNDETGMSVENIEEYDKTRDEPINDIGSKDSGQQKSLNAESTSSLDIVCIKVTQNVSSKHNNNLNSEDSVQTKTLSEKLLNDSATFPDNISIGNASVEKTPESIGTQAIVENIPKHDETRKMASKQDSENNLESQDQQESLFAKTILDVDASTSKSAVEETTESVEVFPFVEDKFPKTQNVSNKHTNNFESKDSDQMQNLSGEPLNDSAISLKDVITANSAVEETPESVEIRTSEENIEKLETCETSSEYESGIDLEVRERQDSKSPVFVSLDNVQTNVETHVEIHQPSSECDKNDDSKHNEELESSEGVCDTLRSAELVSKDINSTQEGNCVKGTALIPASDTERGLSTKTENVESNDQSNENKAAGEFRISIGKDTELSDIPVMDDCGEKAKKQDITPSEEYKMAYVTEIIPVCDVPCPLSASGMTANEEEIESSTKKEASATAEDSFSVDSFTKVEEASQLTSETLTEAKQLAELDMDSSHDSLPTPEVVIADRISLPTGTVAEPLQSQNNVSVTATESITLNKSSDLGSLHDATFERDDSAPEDLIEVLSPITKTRLSSSENDSAGDEGTCKDIVEEIIKVTSDERDDGESICKEENTELHENVAFVNGSQEPEFNDISLSGDSLNDSGTSLKDVNTTNSAVEDTPESVGTQSIVENIPKHDDIRKTASEHDSDSNLESQDQQESIFAKTTLNEDDGTSKSAIDKTTESIEVLTFVEDKFPETQKVSNKHSNNFESEEQMESLSGELLTDSATSLKDVRTANSAVEDTPESVEIQTSEENIEKHDETCKPSSENESGIDLEVRERQDIKSPVFVSLVNVLTNVEKLVEIHQPSSECDKNIDSKRNEELKSSEDVCDTLISAELVPKDENSTKEVNCVKGTALTPASDTERELSTKTENVISNDRSSENKAAGEFCTSIGEDTELSDIPVMDDCGEKAKKQDITPSEECKTVSLTEIIPICDVPCPLSASGMTANEEEIEFSTKKEASATAEDSLSVDSFTKVEEASQLTSETLTEAKQLAELDMESSHDSLPTPEVVIADRISLPTGTVAEPLLSRNNVSVSATEPITHDKFSDLVSLYDTTSESDDSAPEDLIEVLSSSTETSLSSSEDVSFRAQIKRFNQPECVLCLMSDSFCWVPELRTETKMFESQFSVPCTEPGNVCKQKSNLETPVDKNQWTEEEQDIDDFRYFIDI